MQQNKLPFSNSQPCGGYMHHKAIYPIFVDFGLKYMFYKLNNNFVSDV